MPGCCNARGCDRLFGERAARRDARSYRKRGLDRTARRMVSHLAERGVEGLTVVEVGGGVGAIGLELVQRGAARSIVLELSPAYEGFASALAEEAGVADRVDFRLADLAVDEHAVGAVDAVILHRVVCCYPEADRLVAAAARQAREALALSYPPRAWYTRAFAATVNLAMRLLGREYRSFMHPPARFLGEAERGGFHRTLAATSWPWRIAVLERGT